jgi:hypothetical protein
VIPDDVKEFADSVLAHRLVLNTDAGLQGTQPREIIDEIVDAVEPPTTGFLPDADSDETAVGADGTVSNGESRSTAAPKTADDA